MEKVQKKIVSIRYTPSSKPYSDEYTIHSQCTHYTPNISFHNLQHTKKDRVRCLDM